MARRVGSRRGNTSSDAKMRPFGALPLREQDARIRRGRPLGPIVRPMIQRATPQNEPPRRIPCRRSHEAMLLFGRQNRTVTVPFTYRSLQEATMTPLRLLTLT